MELGSAVVDGFFGGFGVTVVAFGDDVGDVFAVFWEDSGVALFVVDFAGGLAADFVCVVFGVVGVSCFVFDVSDVDGFD